MSALPYPEKIHYASSAAITDNVIIVEFGDGHSQRMENGLNAQRETWDIVWAALSKTEFQAAWATLKAAGAVNAMTWDSPLDGVTKKYVAVKDTRKVQKVAHKWRLTLSIRQVFEP
jgi:phage-related protein